MNIPTIQWEQNSVKIIDQTKLPHKLEFIYCGNVEELWEAIRNMSIRGAPALGVAGALGVVLSIYNSDAKSIEKLEKEIKENIDYLKSSRPTAVNLSWALEKMWEKFKEIKNKDVAEIRKILFEEARKIVEEDKKTCREIGKYGAKLINEGDRIITHCNAGALATVDYGTALGVFYYAKGKGKNFHVYVDETRPRLQGARLTTWELTQNEISYTLICDNMTGTLMKQEKVDKVLVGADRIALNGDIANKIGTYTLAVLSNFHNIPFYIVAPSSTFDLNISSGREIPIEERNKDEVRCVGEYEIVPSDTEVYNPAFDVTPNNLIHGIVTEKGIIKPPFHDNIFRILGGK